MSSPLTSPGRAGPRSQAAFAAARAIMPGGVSSPVRAFKAVGGEPPVIARAEGPYLFDLDGNRYIDYVCAYGPLILGHASPAVVAALQEAAAGGTAYGAPTQRETELANRIAAAIPSIERVRFVNSGTEATMTAIRLARGVTGRNKIIKFAGCYHGHSDGLLAKAGSGVATLALPDTAGVPAAYAAETIIVPFNDLAAAREAAARYRGDLAAVIVEPVAANMGVVPPAPGFLQGLREVTVDAGALLIFDEVITGFRVGRAGAQGRYGVVPDITCLGKVIGGGLPVGALGGSAAILEQLAPTGSVYQAGTLSGNPLAMAAGIATLDALAVGGVYETLETRARALANGLSAAAADAGVPYVVSRVGSILTGFFQASAPTNFDEAADGDSGAYARFFHASLAGGVNLAPSQFEAMFVSLAHDDAAIEGTLAVARAGFATIASA